MPFDTPPTQPSPGERWHIEEMERRRIIYWEEEQAEKQRWWESLTPEERAEIKRQRRRKRAEAAAVAEKARREAEERAAAHRASVESYETAHGGAEYLNEYEQYLKGRLAATPAPDYSVSLSGSLLVLMFVALIPGLFFNSVFRSSSGGILFVELATVICWSAWVLRRRERGTLRTELLRAQEQIARWRGCGDAGCAECYPNRHFRTRWSDARAAQEHPNGCAFADCEACYPDAAR